MAVPYCVLMGFSHPAVPHFRPFSHFPAPTKPTFLPVLTKSVPSPCLIPPFCPTVKRVNNPPRSGESGKFITETSEQEEEAPYWF